MARLKRPERPGLGPWLNQPDEWDGLIVAKYDRLTRSLLDFLVLYKWLNDRGKTLIWIDPPLDFSTPFGKAMANVLITFAELELAVISDRIREAWHGLREAGKWPGGTVPFGRVPVRAEPNGWRLAPDPEYAPIVIEMVRRYLAGDSFHMLARWLNEAGIPTSRDAQRLRNGKPATSKGWTAAVVSKLLASPSLVGHVLAGGESLRDRDGLIVRIDPLIPPEDYERLQAALRGRAYGRRGSMPLNCCRWPSARSALRSCISRPTRAAVDASSGTTSAARPGGSDVKPDGYRPTTSKAWPLSCSCSWSAARKFWSASISRPTTTRRR
jgi:DNA invertase Pin-like site-specific DNA recombinase